MKLKLSMAFEALRGKDGNVVVSQGHAASSRRWPGRRRRSGRSEQRVRARHA